MMWVCDECDGWLGTSRDGKPCMFCGHWRCHWEPSPKDIQDRMQLVQATWSDQDRQAKARHAFTAAVTVPEYTPYQQGKRKRPPRVNN